MATIVATRTDLKKMNLKQSDLIPVSALGAFGFDDDIIKSLAKYEILPQVLKVQHVYYMIREEVFGLVNRFIKNELAIYKAVEDKENLLAESAKFIEENKVKLTKEDLEKIEAGEANLVELLQMRASEPKDI
jgi:hypothetical protein